VEIKQFDVSSKKNLIEHIYSPLSFIGKVNILLNEYERLDVRPTLQRVPFNLVITRVALIARRECKNILILWLLQFSIDRLASLALPQNKDF